MKRMNSLFALLVLLAVLLSACGPAAPSASVAQSGASRETAPNVPQSDMQALVAGNNAFAFDLYRSLRSENGNLILSPYSISLALAMTYAGARGQTESQMAQTLHFDLPQTQLHPAFDALDLALAKEGGSSSDGQSPLQLKIANAVWAEQTFTFLPDFLDTLARNYGAGVRLADFKNNYEPARKEINGWVSDQTNKKIQDLLAQGTLNPDTRMVLVNAIYFKADWLDTFKKEDTSNADFHLLDGSTVQTPTMHQTLSASYAQGDGWQAVELPYAGATAAMTILVPDAGKFDTFDSTLDGATFDSILAAMHPATIQLALPKFSFTRDFGLADQLSALGMTDAFNRDRADFSGMTGKRDLFISNVVHKAFVAVDEKGTEAAAATGVIMEATGALLTEVTLNIDRPFLFVIRDTTSGQILFVGRVVNPAK